MSLKLYMAGSSLVHMICNEKRASFDHVNNNRSTLKFFVQVYYAWMKTLSYTFHLTHTHTHHYRQQIYNRHRAKRGCDAAIAIITLAMLRKQCNESINLQFHERWVDFSDKFILPQFAYSLHRPIFISFNSLIMAVFECSMATVFFTICYLSPASSPPLPLNPLIHHLFSFSSCRWVPSKICQCPWQMPLQSTWSP